MLRESKSYILSCIAKFRVLNIDSSSLARIEKSHARLEEDVGVIVDHLRRSNTMGATIRSTPTPGGPTGALPSINSAALGDDGLFKLSLAVAFKQNAEEKQPWTTISASEWIRAGTWWLWRVCTSAVITL